MALSLQFYNLAVRPDIFPAAAVKKVVGYRKPSVTVRCSVDEDAAAAGAVMMDEDFNAKEFRKNLWRSKNFNRKGFGRKEDTLKLMNREYTSDIIKTLKENGYQYTWGNVTVKLAEAYGFCWGVERAVQIAYEARTQFPTEKIWITNEIIHNPTVNKRLEDMKVELIPIEEGKKKFDIVDKGDVVILPAFGAAVEAMVTLNNKNVQIVDTTCPWVAKVWNSVEKHQKGDYTSIIHGKYNHEETVATASFAAKYVVVKNMKEAMYVCDYILGGELDGSSSTKEAFIEKFKYAVSEGFDPEPDRTEIGKRLWIGPRVSPSVKDRLMMAVDNLKNCMLDRDILIQIWVPTKRGGKQVLTTKNQPFSLLNPSCQRLVNYRSVSSVFQFPADGSKLSVGLPGLVFLEKLPEWTPDVRYFKKAEYPRIDFANQYDVRGSIAVPVFQRGNSSCLGVVEFVTTTQKTNYRPELETVCRALEAVDLSSSHSFSPPGIKASCDSHNSVVPQIVEILTLICKEHRLPLAQTWAPCLQQGKDGCRHSNENYTFCVSTLDSALFASNEEMLEFHEACSEYHLFQGQGLIGRALLTNKPIFASNVTAFTKTEYPLSHHARMFGLHAAAAIPLQGILPGLANFVFEFFLPKDCLDIGEQKGIMDSLSTNILHSCQNIKVVTSNDSARQVSLPAWEIVIASDGAYDIDETQQSVSSSNDFYSEEPSWISNIMEAQENDKDIPVIAESQEEPNKVRFTASCNNILAELDQEQIFAECAQLQKNAETNVINEANKDSSINEHSSHSSKKSDERRRNKAEKTISLQTLQQYFAGSLKDAAKNLGVCPTTLKRICRQHGISRWPSRKIKKVDHSLKKLQRVMDTVHGAQGSIPIGTFYKSFPKLKSSNNPANAPTCQSNRGDQSKQTESQPDDVLGTQKTNASKCPSSSGSQSQSSDSTTCSTGANHETKARNGSASGTKDQERLLERVVRNKELRVPHQEEPQNIARPQSHKLISDHPNSLRKLDNKNLMDGSFRVKATFGDEIVRFSLPVNSQFTSLQKEIARRLNVEDFKGIGLKYLDDEGEWVLLTCDGDLEECLVIHSLSQSQTIKLSIYQASKRDPFNANGPS